MKTQQIQMTANNPLFHIQRNSYAMASETGEEAEITMYGEIVESTPTDYWTGEPIEGQFIVQDEFLNDLNTITSSGSKKVKLRMNSVGGDAGVSMLIHNRLRELAGNGVEISCIVDGVAMSGGSLIMCAADNVIVYPSSLIMIHKCWSFLCGGYNADDLREQAKTNDAWDNSQVAIYKRKCNLSETVILHMMAETTYMTGKEAVEKGFANVLENDADEAPIAASADRQSLFVRGRQIYLAHGMKAPDNIPTVSTEKSADINIKKPADTGSIEGGTPMAKNLEELRAENAELASQVESEVRAAVSAENTAAIEQATSAERNRISQIDEIACLYDEETVREAKYGEHPCTAAEMAFRAATKAAKEGTAFMANAQKDFQASGASNVGAAPAPEDNGKTGDEDKESIKASAKSDVEMYKRMKEAR